MRATVLRLFTEQIHFS